MKHHMKAGTKAKNFIKSKRGLILAAVVVLAGISLLGGISYAKYYASKYRQGISVASGLYFNSNKLYKDRGDTTNIADIDTSGMMVNVNDEKWSGGNLNFNIEIRNYDSNLLYNDANLNVGYEVAFMLVDEPEGASYQVKEAATGTIKSLTKKGQVITFSDGELQGGSLERDEYQLTITMENKDTYNGARVLAVAYPTAPDYLYAPTDQQHRLVGLFQGIYSETVMKVDTSEFLVQSETDYSDSTWAAKVKDLSGLIYNIKTIGDVVADDNNAVAQEAIVKWNSDYLSINQYDDYYVTAKQNGNIETKTENGHEWTYMKINILPYTSIDITFYKTDEFINSFSSMSRADFEGLADAYTETEETP